MKKAVQVTCMALVAALPATAFAAYTEPTNSIIIEAAILGAVIFGVLGGVMLRSPAGAVIGAIVGAAAGAVMAIL